MVAYGDQMLLPVNTCAYYRPDLRREIRLEESNPRVVFGKLVGVRTAPVHRKSHCTLTAPDGLQNLP